MFDIGLLVGVITLMILHLAFAWKALNSTSVIDPKRRTSWTLLSFILGPAGYYFYLGTIPCELIDGE
ncbi:hypothetical protein L9G15_04660 [Shewanella sp. A3A]|uniref:Cardiolipin synthase N-terminal domain-containing protein n=1 Tax=Shewanella electrica TaxID=515560 RepID=A0ABT2FKB1_9GAMM|nr:hypothetical protein [Shewanella electrica]MCH1918719.1 hypothetical protein [Shewanella ferrihydritica]MCH1923583.1 hypothetical protein [Shewanella electrica]MCS4555679.1 hypothetical protein [Shewanella electrica]